MRFLKGPIPFQASGVQSVLPSSVIGEKALLSRWNSEPNKLFYSFWIIPRPGETLSVSTRDGPSDLWVFAGALTSHIGLHVLRFSDIFTRERNREERSLSIFGDMIPWFHESSKRRFLLYSHGKFLAEFFCCLTFSMLDTMSYGRIVTSGE
jgi:hypothetical protein